jgi:uncharacterized glyoxalase superfamily protein PhnB
MNPTPAGWPRFSSAIVYQDAARAIDWLCDAFGFEIKLKVEGDEGRIEHCELIYGDGLLMVAQEDSRPGRAWRPLLKSPRSVAGANTQTLMFYVDDADSHCAQARARGAQIVEEPTVHDYGDAYWSDRSYGAIDPEGHVWWITQRLRSAPQLEEKGSQ